MSDTVDLRTFPSNKNEALAMAYINSIDLSDKEPKEIARLYDKALQEITEENRLIFRERRLKE